MKYKKYRTIKLPKVIVDAFMVKLTFNPPEFDFKLDIAITMINDILIKNPIYNKDNIDRLIFSPLDSRYLKQKYGNNYAHHIHYLTNNGIIWNDYYYQGRTTYFYLQEPNNYQQQIETLLYVRNTTLEEVHTTYCFPKTIKKESLTLVNTDIDKYQKNGNFGSWYTIEIEIGKGNRRYLTKNYEEDSKYINNAPKHIKKMGGYFRKHFRIHYQNAVTYIDNNLAQELEYAANDEEMARAFNRYWSWMGSINAIENGRNNKSLRFNRNKTNNRLDTNLTNMAGGLRKFIVGYENMVYLDLKNAQPVLFNVMLNDYRKDASESLLKEMDRYFELTTSGQWYEELARIYNQTREDAKDRWMEIAYSKNDSYRQHKWKFEKEYPGIYGIIHDRKRKDHAQFSIDLQKLESKIFIDEICRELVVRDIIPYTLHDGLMVLKDRKEETLRIMKTVLKGYLGVEPIISVE